MPIAILGLAAAAFVIGTSEFVVVGVIPSISSDLGTSLTTTSLLVTGYALAVALGTPVLTAVTGRFQRRPLLITLLAVYALANVVAATAPGFEVLMGSRIVMAVAHGVFFGVAATVATTLVERERAGAAVAGILSGLTLAMVVGVPLGAWVGNSLSWRASFGGIAVLGAMGLVALQVVLPKRLEHPPATTVRHQLSVFGNGRLFAIYAIMVAGMGGTFAAFTFLTPLLTDVTGASETLVSVALVLFGVGTFAGTLASGRLVDRVGMKPALLVVLTSNVVVLLLIRVALESLVPMLVLVTVWGFTAFALSPVAAAGAVLTANEVAPSVAATASGMAVAAINLGIAFGSFVGGRTVDASGLVSTPWVGMALLLLATATTAAFTRTPRALPDRDHPESVPA